MTVTDPKRAKVEKIIETSQEPIVSKDSKTCDSKQLQVNEETIIPEKSTLECSENDDATVSNLSDDDKDDSSITAVKQGKFEEDLKKTVHLYDHLKTNDDDQEDFIPELATVKTRALCPRLVAKCFYTVYKILSTLPNVVKIPLAKQYVNVCGDIHGQYVDLLNIFRKYGEPSNENVYLFNGDLVDRGRDSINVLFLLFSYKIAFPDSVHICRGNHEDEFMNESGGLLGEFHQKFRNDEPQTLFDACNMVLSALPIAHIIDDRLFVVHGGLTSDGDTITIDDIQKFNRHIVRPEIQSPLCQLLWSDPREIEGIRESFRGDGVNWGEDITRKFLDNNKFEQIIRSHECVEEGYQLCHSGLVATLFSAPNYCGNRGNTAAIIRIDPEGKQKISHFR